MNLYPLAEYHFKPNLQRPFVENEVLLLPPNNTYNSFWVKITTITNNSLVLTTSNGSTFKFKRDLFPLFYSDIWGYVHAQTTPPPSLRPFINSNQYFHHRGNDSLTYIHPTKPLVIKTHSTLPYHWINGDPCPSKLERFVYQHKISEHLRLDHSLPLLQQTLIFHEGRPFTISEKLDTRQPLRQHHYLSIRKTLIDLHKAGYSLNDRIQAGIQPSTGNVFIYDTGSITPLPPNDTHAHIDLDQTYLDQLASTHNLRPLPLYPKESRLTKLKIKKFLNTLRENRELALTH